MEGCKFDCSVLNQELDVNENWAGTFNRMVEMKIFAGT